MGINFIEILLLFFLFYIFSNHIINNYLKYIEPLSNQNVTSPKSYTNTNLDNDPLYLAKVNAANNKYLHEQVKLIMKNINQLKIQNTKLKNNVKNNTDYIYNKNHSLNQAAQKALPSSKNFHKIYKP